MLRLLTEGHVSPGISVAAKKAAGLNILPLRDWHGGIHLHKKDSELLSLAWSEGFDDRDVRCEYLPVYDQKSH
jgi:hypothetical protein